jgi:hypothetical protein
MAVFALAPFMGPALGKSLPTPIPLINPKLTILD